MDDKWIIRTMFLLAVIAAFLLVAVPARAGDFIPTGNINLRGIYNLTNLSDIHSFNLVGDIIGGSDINASRLFGEYNWVVLAGEATPYFIFNGTVFEFNETFLNVTIDARENITTYTAGLGLNFSNDVFSLNLSFTDSRYFTQAVANAQFFNLSDEEQDNWTYAYSYLLSKSGDWNVSFSIVDANHSNWDLSFLIVDANHSNWDSAAFNVSEGTVNAARLWDALDAPDAIHLEDLNSTMVTGKTFNPATNTTLTWDFNSVNGSGDNDFRIWNANLTLINGSVYGDNINAVNWDSAFSIVDANHSGWDSTEASVNANFTSWVANTGNCTGNGSCIFILYDFQFNTSGLLKTGGSGDYSIVTDSSSNWNAAFENISTTADNWTYAYTYVLGKSGDWNVSFSIVDANHSRWDGSSLSVNDNQTNWTETQLSVFGNTPDYYNASNIDGVNLNITLNWTQLQAYPSACPAGTYATTIGDSITCTAAMRTNGENTTGRYNISGFVFNSSRFGLPTNPLQNQIYDNETCSFVKGSTATLEVC